jgi:hypothetical protein
MERIVREYIELQGDVSFRRFQNELSQKMYDALGQGYISSDNEVSLVNKLVDIINDSRFNKFRFYSHKIHGPRSYVEFNYRDRPITKEIADMAIVSIASYKRKRILQKVSFVQNKTDRDKKWAIDDEQLFLLKNFPRLSGSKGIFKSFSNEDIVFLNHSRCLGAFGLFMSPGEMIFLSAPLLSELKRDNGIAIEDIRQTETVANVGTHNFPLSIRSDHHLWEEFFYYIRKYGLEYVFFTPFLSNGSLPFLGNCIFSRDIYDFVRDWTQFNIGEPTYAFGSTLDPILDRFANFLLRTIGIQEYVDLPLEGVEGKFGNAMAVFVMHMDLGRERQE